jgi:predicted DNA-binding protein (UPF0251 family)/predicted Fe-Mo cluster-binding NifX family protein
MLIIRLMRPKSCRRVGSQPYITYFKPRGVPLSELEEIVLTVDEFEALRLADHEGLYHEEAAVRMNVSRPTLGRILDAARRKVADALVGGKALRIEGGRVEVAETVTPTIQEGKMNIAVSTMDGSTICGHLGKCKTFLIYETDGKEVKKKYLRAAGSACPGHGEGSEGHAHNVSPFAGCHAVITQGMGQGMLNGLVHAGIQPVITDQTDPDKAVKLFLGGGLPGTSTSNCVCGEHDH